MIRFNDSTIQRFNDSTIHDTWHWLDTGACACDYNMALDQALMYLAPQFGHPILRFYGWTQPAASFGYSQCHADIELITPLRPLVRRPTGGGLVPHNADWTYSAVFPPNHAWYSLKAAESYERIHQWVRDSFAGLGMTTSLAQCAVKEAPGQCFIGAEKSDVMWKGRKIAGAAQRRTHQGLLIQGSVQPPPLDLARPAWQESMLRIAREQWGVCWSPLHPPESLIALAEELKRTKYSQPAYNERRQGWKSS